ncbi:hypothetical protein, partial [Promicromonospora kroppenstedtii]|uniref:hypothetical protein n=1 Tax=Promicromonospora kroppenstedtii TaxID=440482 RepID=UPI00055A3F7B
GAAGAGSAAGLVGNWPVLGWNPPDRWTGSNWTDRRPGWAWCERGSGWCSGTPESGDTGEGMAAQ